MEEPEESSRPFHSAVVGGGDRRGRLERWTGAACYAEELTLTSSSQGSATAGFNLGKTRPALWFRNLGAAG